MALSGYRRLAPCADAEEAEVLTVKYGLQELASKFRGKIIVEIDCASLAPLSKPKSQNKSALHHAIADIKLVMQNFQETATSVIRRTCNSVAHELAAYARVHGDCACLLLFLLISFPWLPGIAIAV